MFKKLKKADKENAVKLLAHLVAVGAAGAAVPVAIAKAFVQAEPTFATVPNTTPDATGNVAMYVTPAGIAASGGSTTPVSSDATPVESKFELATDFAVPPPAKRGGLVHADTYPFAKMEVGQSFFIAATDAKPNPAKSMNSTVSSANRRFAAVYPVTTGKDKTPHAKAGQPTGQDGRKFTVRPRVAGQDGEKANGARVWRIA